MIATNQNNTLEKPNLDPYPDGPMRERDPEPDRISRPDTVPPPNSAPAQPDFPTPLPVNSPP